MIPDPAWGVLDSSSSFTMYEAAPDVVVIWPTEGCNDTEETAEESVAAQRAHWSSAGRSGGAIVMMDHVHEQTNAARKVYQSAESQGQITAFALVGGTTFGRAVSSVFLGIQRPRIPTKAFADFDDAMAWVQGQGEG